MVGPCNCCMLLGLSWQSGRCTLIQITGNISNSFFCPWLLDKWNTLHAILLHFIFSVVADAGCLQETPAAVIVLEICWLKCPLSARLLCGLSIFFCQRKRRLWSWMHEPHIRSSGWLNFVQQHLIFVGSQYGSCFTSHIWCLEFLTPRILENLCTPSFNDISSIAL
jgi:hypothetical protein